MNDDVLMASEAAAATKQVVHYAEDASAKDVESVCGENETGSVTDKLDEVTCKDCKEDLEADAAPVDASKLFESLGPMLGSAFGGIMGGSGLSKVADAIVAHTAVYRDEVALRREALELEREKMKEIRRTADGVETLIERLFHTVR